VTDVVGRYAYGRPVVRKATQFAKKEEASQGRVAA
jgi:hypothetical protein